MQKSGKNPFRVGARRSGDAIGEISTLDFGTIAHPFQKLTAFQRSTPTSSISEDRAARAVVAFPRGWWEREAGTDQVASAIEVARKVSARGVAIA
jgi:hypothetical protein